jgi:mannose-6-phosphate isomerase
VQVHPDDALAEERHNSFGKTEAWYVVDCKEGAAIYLGFKDLNLTREEYIAAVAESRLEELLNKVEVKPGDTFFIPAGTVHALGAGLEVVEVQQTSDITYRIYDWDRVDAEGNSRELHTALAVDAIDFEADAELLHRKYDLQRGSKAKVIESNYFTMVLHDVAGSKSFDHSALDSFVVYIALNGSVRIIADGNEEELNEGEVILIPAETNEVIIEGNAKLMEVYIDK